MHAAAGAPVCIGSNARQEDARHCARCARVSAECSDEESECDREGMDARLGLGRAIIERQGPVPLDAHWTVLPASPVVLQLHEIHRE